MAKFISNNDFKYLTNEQRAHLKKDYHNYICINGNKVHYIQDTNEYYFKKHLEELCVLSLEPLTIYMNDELGQSLGLLPKLNSVELF